MRPLGGYSVANNPLRYIDPTGHAYDEFGAYDRPEKEPPTQGETDPYPFYDRESGAVQHLISSCGRRECRQAAFNAYTPGHWDFKAADEFGYLTSLAYESGDVSWSDARQAAIEGRPNPLSREQLSDAIRSGSRKYTKGEGEMVENMNALQYVIFIDLFDDWGPEELGDPANYEPHYLEVLIRKHHRLVDKAYERYKELAEKGFDFLEPIGAP